MREYFEGLLLSTRQEYEEAAKAQKQGKELDEDEGGSDDGEGMSNGDVKVLGSGGDGTSGSRLPPGMTSDMMATQDDSKGGEVLMLEDAQK